MLFRSRENAKAFLADNLDLMVEISDKIRKEVGIDDAPEGDVEIDVTDEESIDAAS